MIQKELTNNLIGKALKMGVKYDQIGLFGDPKASQKISTEYD